MQREINPPDEIIRRLFFVLYLFMMVFLFVVGLLGLVQQRYDYLQLACLGGAAAFALRRYGKRHLDFDRLAESFPHGIEDGPDRQICRQVSEILAEASRREVDWQQRQQLRQKLIALMEENPETWPWFQRDVAEVFPALSDWLGKKGNG